MFNIENASAPIGLTVLMRLLADGKIPSKYVKGLKKLRDMLNLAFPAEGQGNVEIV